MTASTKLERYIIKFDKNRNFSQSKPKDIINAERERKYFVSKFPPDKILKIKKEDYVQGIIPTNRNSFSYLVEFGTRWFGTPGGGDTRKHAIFFSKATQKYRYYDKVYKNFDQAYSSLLKGIEKIVGAGKQYSIDGDYHKLETLVEGRKNFLALSVITKFLALYYPQTFLRLWSHKWINAVLKVFQISSDQYDEESGFYKKHQMLLDIKKNHPIMKNWNNWYFSHFIISAINDGFHLEDPDDISGDVETSTKAQTKTQNKKTKIKSKNSNNIKHFLSEDEILSREAESRPKKKPMSKKDLEKLNEQIKETVTRQKSSVIEKTRYERIKSMVFALKQIHKKCMICKQDHFQMQNGSFYSEVSHIIPFNVSHKDNMENLMVICPTCHKKFDNARYVDRRQLYKKLCRNFPKMRFERPQFI